MLVGLFTGMLLARLLGPDGRGIVGTIVTYATMLITLGQLSVGDVAVIEERKLGETQALATAWTVSLTNLLVAVPLLTTAVWSLFQTETNIPILLSILYVLTFALSYMINQLYLGVFRIRHQFSKVQIYALTKPTLYLLFLLLLATGIVTPAIETVLIALILSDLLAIAVRAAIDGLPFIGRFDYSKISGFLKTALPLHLTKVVQSLGTQGDKLLAVMFLSAHDIGIFLIATTFATIIPGIYSTATKLLVLPAMLSMDGNTRGGQANQMLRMTWAASIMACLLTATVAHMLIPLLFGVAFANASGMAVWLAFANLMRPVRESLLEVQKSFAITRYFALPSAVLFAVFLVVALLLFPVLGVFGIIIGRGVAELVTVVVLSRGLQKYAPEIRMRDWIVPQWHDFVMLVSQPWKAVFGGRKTR